MPLPTGTVSFLFTDIAGSTPLWERHHEAMACAMIEHDAILATVVEEQDGCVFKKVGDACCAAFATSEQALRAALEGQLRLDAHDWGEVGRIEVRMAVHTGNAEAVDGDYLGPSVNRVARILGLAHPRQVLASRATAELVLTTPSSSLRLEDLGGFELRGIARRERVYQLVHPDLPSEFPPIAGAPSPPTNLPVQLSSFVGRVQELASIQQRLLQHRLVTLTGVGGSGKTRLAIEAGMQALDWFSEGVWIVELAPLIDPDLVVRGVADALAIHGEPGVPLQQTILRELKNRRLLLILDNCEHLLDAVANFAESLLKAAPRLHLLATSREALGITGEVAVRVASMSVPEKDSLLLPEDLDRYDATRLFVERALAANPTLELTSEVCETIAQVCRRLDGIPLAVELAASRLRGMPVSELAKRLDDRFRILTGGSRTAVSRQRTLKALIDWSYDLLSHQEKVVLQRLSVFAGAWTTEAAEMVCSDGDVESWEVFEHVSRLVEKSLVVMEPETDGAARYRLLETIRQYAADALADADGSEAARDRHFNYYVNLVETIPTADDPEIHARNRRNLQSEWDNVRSAFEWAMATRPEEALRMAATPRIGPIARPFEARDMVGRVLEATADLGATRERTMAMINLARTNFLLTNIEESSAAAMAAQDMAIQLGDRRHEAMALGQLANIATMRGDEETARRIFEQLLEIGEGLGDDFLIARGHYGLMLGARRRVDLKEWDQRLIESDRALRKSKEWLYVYWSEGYRGNWHEARGDLPAAARSYASALRSFRQIQVEQGTVWQWEFIASLCHHLGDHERAAKLLGAAEAQRHRIRWPLQLDEVERVSSLRDSIRSILGEDFDALYSEGGSLSTEAATQSALEAAERISGTPPPFGS